MVFIIFIVSGIIHRIYWYHTEKIVISYEEYMVSYGEYWYQYEEYIPGI